MSKRILGMASVLLAVAMVQGGDAVKKDLEKLQGKWQVVSMIEVGEKTPDDVLKEMELSFQGDKLTVKEKNETVAEFTIKLDPSKMPAIIDFDQLGDKKGEKMLGIYAFEGEMVKFCYDEDGKERPKEFASKPKTSISLVVLKKKK